MIRSASVARPRFHTYRRSPGLGSMNYWDLLAQAPRRDCDPWDSACVAQNVAMVTAVQDYWDTHMYLPGGVPEGTQLDFNTLSARQLQQFEQNVIPTSGVMTVDEQPYVSMAVPGPAPGEASRAYVSSALPIAVAEEQINPGSFSFTNTTRGGSSTFYVGDSWQVSIRGASPNQPVWVAGMQNGASPGMTQMGSTDASGNFATTGTMTPDTVGSWVEVWNVGPPSNSTGAEPKFAFTVAAATATTPDGKNVIVSNGADQAPGAKKDEQAATPSTSITDWLQASILGGGIPNWGLVAAGMGAIFVFGGSRGR